MKDWTPEMWLTLIAGIIAIWSKIESGMTKTQSTATATQVAALVPQVAANSAATQAVALATPAPAQTPIGAPASTRVLSNGV